MHKNGVWYFCSIRKSKTRNLFFKIDINALSPSPTVFLLTNIEIVFLEPAETKHVNKYLIF